MKSIKHISVDEQIQRNRHKVILVIFMFLLTIMLFSIGCACIYDLVAVPDMQLDIINVSIIMCMITIIYIIVMIRNSRKILMFLNHAIPLNNRNQAPILYDAVQEMAVAFGLPFNRIGICINTDSSPNAFSIGNLRQTNHGWSGYASVGVTAGLNILNRSELVCVIGHEMSHIKTEDTRLESIGISLMMLFSVVSKGCYEVAWHSTDNSFNDNDGSEFSNTNPISSDIWGFVCYFFVQVFALVLMLLSLLGWICSGLCYLTQICLSKSRDYLADAMSVKMTQNPNDLINALIIVNNAPRITSGNPASNSIYFESILPRPKHVLSIGNLFDSHPSTSKRIYRIKQTE